MKITFYSNFFNHHQLPFCEALYKKLGDDFKFIATEPIPEERLKLGYSDLNKKYPFIITTYDIEENKLEAMKLCIESDVVITGSAPEIYTKTRIKQNKLTFRYSERVYKQGIWRVISPRGLYNMIKNHTIYRNKKLYMLCASAYTAGDLKLVGAYKNKTYKWGYYPKFISYDVENLMKNKMNKKVKILWCGRFIEWKHPEKAIYVAKKLKEDGYIFELNMIGIGDLEEEVNKLVKMEKLENEVNLLGSMKPENVRKHMEESNIFLFTSDYQEGWGAVLNEAMNSACSIVASHSIGSVPFLIEDGKNGLIYNNDSDEDLYNNVKKVLDDRNLMNNLGIKAYYKLKDEWNEHTAAERFYKIAKGLLNDDLIEFKEGPCSIAEPVYQWNMFKYCKNIRRRA